MLWVHPHKMIAIFTTLWFIRKARNEGPKIQQEDLDLHTLSLDSPLKISKTTPPIHLQGRNQQRPYTTRLLRMVYGYTQMQREQDTRGNRSRKAGIGIFMQDNTDNTRQEILIQAIHRQCPVRQAPLHAQWGEFSLISENCL
ncbi:hypothetical protein SEVIR_3G412033v4 [Setaria viridis]